MNLIYINLLEFQRLQTGIFGKQFILRCSVILIVLVCQRRIWGSSPHFVGTNIQISREVKRVGCVWTLSWGSVHMELSMGQLVASLYAVHSLDMCSL